MSFSLSGTALDKLKQTANMKGATAEVDQIEGEERLSGPFCYTVRFHLKGGGDKSSAPNFNKVIGKSMALSLEHGGGRSRMVSGIISKIRHHGRGVPIAKKNEKQKARDTPEIEAPSFFAKIRPSLWRLHLQNSYRTYSDRAVVSTGSNDPSGILDDLLGTYYQSGNITKNLNGNYPERKHVAQKGETDLEFLQRLCEEAGVVYFFDEGNIVLTDHNGGYGKYSRNGGSGQGPDTLRKVSQHTRARKEGVLNSYSYERNLTPGTAQLRSVDHSQSSQVSDSVTSSGADGLQTVRETGKQTQYSTKRPRDAFLSTLEKRSAAQITGGKSVLRGHTHSHLLGVGMRFGLDSGTCGDILSHFSSDSQKFVVSRLQVSVNQQVKMEGKEGKFTKISDILNVEFEAVPQPDGSNYRGNRYAEQTNVSSGAGGDGGHLRRRFNVIVEKYNLLRDTVFSLARNEMPSQIPSGAKGLEEINPYEFSIEPKVGTGAGSRREKEIPAGIYTAEVAAPDSTKKAKKKREQGMVRVKIDLDGDISTEVWARTLSFWAGNQYGGQFLPREGAKVAVAYTAQSGEYPFIVGGFYDGKHNMPFPDDPREQSGIRGKSHRTDSGNYLHNEISLIDKQNEEEVRILSPMYRTDVTGLEKDVGTTREFFQFGKIKIPNAQGVSSPSSLQEREDFMPTAPRAVTSDEKGTLPSGSEKICELKGIIKEIKEKYEVSSSANPSDRISLKSYAKLDESTKFKVKDSVPKSVKNEINKKEISIHDFMYNLTEDKKVERKSEVKGEGELWWYTVSDKKGGRWRPEREITYEKYDNIKDKIQYGFYKKDGSNYSMEGRGAGVQGLIKDMRKISSGQVDGEIRVTSLGRDIYEVVGSREVYEVKSFGQDAYEVEPYKELYPPPKKSVNPLKHADQKRADYTEGGALNACQGEFKIHTFGDRLEIFRAPEGDSKKSVFDQEMTEDWEPEGMPEEHDQFEDDDPIMILNKDGSIVIQSEEGINIESNDDINIQSSGSINMYAEKKINHESGEKSEIVSPEIKIGDQQITRSIEIRSQNHFTHHNGAVIKVSQEAAKLKFEQTVFTFAGFHMTNAACHFIHSPVGIKIVEALDGKAALYDSKTVGVDNKNAALDMKFTLVETGQGGILQEDEMAKMKNRLSIMEDNLSDANNSISNMRNEVVKAIQGGMSNDVNAMQDSISGLKNYV